MGYPPFKWHGGKSPSAKEIVALMDGVEHLNYLEPYFGAGSVLLAKDPNGKSEIANDIYLHLFDFFSVLRDQERYQELITRCQLTPVSEKSWQEAVEMLSQENLPQVERAYAFYVSVQQSRQGLQNDFLTVAWAHPNPCVCSRATRQPQFLTSVAEPLVSDIPPLTSLEQNLTSRGRPLILLADPLFT